MENEKKNKMTLIFFSGTMDKAVAMLMLAVTAASMGMEVSVFCTFWGLSFLKKGRKYSRKNLFQKMLEFMVPSKKDRLPLTNLNMLGIGPAMMASLMKKTKTPDVDELFKTARELKVKFYACSTSCGVMGIPPDNLIEESDGVLGAAAYLKEASEAKINLFI